MKLLEKLENLYEKLDNRRTYPLRKKRKKKNTRETFMKMFTRTCERVYSYAYEHSSNREDAELITRDAFVYMYVHIGSLRKSQSLDVWQKQCVEKSFRALLRTRLMSLVPDADADSADLHLDERQRDALWAKIDKIATIDPWRLVPEPGKSTVFSVLADQTMSDLRFMSVGDFILAAAIVIGSIAAVIYGAAFVVNYISTHQTVELEARQEIFLDERNYDGFSESGGPQVSIEQGSDAYSQSVNGRTSGHPSYTSDGFTNAEIIKIVKQIITDDMSDFEAIEAIYNYVGENMLYTDIKDEYDYEEFVAYFVEHGRGDSRHYSAAVCALCRAAGYECEVIAGGFVLNKNTEFERTVEHYWNKLTLGAIEYYLDVEADSNSDGTDVRHYYFMAADGNNKWDLFERDHYFD